jgi:hypothetical protein
LDALVSICATLPQTVVEQPPELSPNFGDGRDQAAAA